MEIKVYEKNELLSSSKMKEYKDLVQELEEVNLLDFDSLEEYDEVKKTISALQSKINKFAESEIKPIKQAFDNAKKVVLDLEKAIVEKIKKIKKTYEYIAVEKGIVLKKIEIKKVDCCGDCGSTNIVKKEILK